MRSIHGDMTARPAGIGRGRATSVPWKCKECNADVMRLIWRRSCRRAKQRPPPAESPASTMLVGETGVCGESDGGYKREM